MADFTLLIRERVNLEGTERGTDYNLTISDIIYSDNRIFNIPSGSEITIFSLGDTNGAGQFVTSSLKYARITNHSTSVPVNLRVSSSTENMNFSIAAGGSFMLSTSEITGSVGANPLIGYDNIVDLKLEPSGSSAKVEYFIATT
jgi:hypothetical protein